MDIDASGWLDTSEVLDFMRDIGIDINVAHSEVMFARYGKRINFYTFLGLFDFKNETILQFAKNQEGFVQLDNPLVKPHIKVVEE
mmetsp:Transcript_38423/g.83760  ORF Transcript_38423/g.83760 Transcript_38423/m.83760 type:complete len:85 (+) Transcript_38423:483-737(+)|eukprot:CAMPEP_0116899710 /NCGR_PEP_ID=MMETSP0467-20121206/8217_1 /TAXON_ID=283647 /ORGANISM="Mesodinium pulex, Strain SPMC105" /LENGTH=84 /DNA_ID=CAMNT_0004572679 /DNA_START=1157 /DNA_END=1411 /DNA_ORIENTATION=-